MSEHDSASPEPPSDMGRRTIIAGAVATVVAGGVFVATRDGDDPAPKKATPTKTAAAPKTLPQFELEGPLGGSAGAGKDGLMLFGRQDDIELLLHPDALGEGVVGTVAFYRARNDGKLLPPPGYAAEVGAKGEVKLKARASLLFGQEADAGGVWDLVVSVNPKDTRSAPAEGKTFAEAVKAFPDYRWARTQVEFSPKLSSSSTKTPSAAEVPVAAPPDDDE